MASPEEREPQSEDYHSNSDSPVTKTPDLGVPSSSHYCGRLYSSPLNDSDVAYYVGLAVITLASIATRLYKIDEPYHVAWDETHFGKHASWYIQGRFFFDVHPPLGKLIIAVAGVLTGYNGSFEFEEPGQQYKDTPYVGMRVACAVLGLLVVPLGYLTVWELVRSTTAALLAGVMLLCETGTLVLSQYILLDPPLIFFIMAASFCTARFINCRNEPFDMEWWYWLSLSGMFIGCAFSVKWVGLFVIALVGLTTLKDLWDLWGDLTLTMKVIAQHFLARVLCLIIWPAVIYMTIFAFHLMVLSNSGNGDGFFSSEFQSMLVGNELYDHKVPEFVAYGSVVTLKNNRGGGGLLHSHSHLYPEEYGNIQQQQVTAYTHKDDNNRWLVKRHNHTEPEEDGQTVLTHGDWVVLEHTTTQRNLHSHALKAPMTATHYQVTCYGEDGAGDANDVWEVEVVGGVSGDPVRTVASKIRLRHVNVGCYLHSHSTQLPKWGWEQLEVTCNPRRLDKNNLWNVEGNLNDAMPMVSFDFYKPSFLSRFLESHIVMAESNSNMKPKEGEITSQPWHWPINYQGQHFSGGDYRVYLLGNPVVFWSCGVLFLLFLMILVGKLLVDQRGLEYSPVLRDTLDCLLSGGGWLLLGWFLHYLPFYLMGRVLYFHHYFPALMFSIMLAGTVLEFAVSFFTSLFPYPLQGTVYHTALAVLISLIIGSFVMFSPLAYGMNGPKADVPNSSYSGLKWLQSWDI
ncbi:protein O-mannosyl-transferase 2-like isoform X2 [Halichondria panicea]|uniref:protein O-mannosyl-transferase 2-like isoform X1 n=1 Tax=Halichondria panicea TaxID=6063 RepID=UPI00312BA0D6